MPINELGISAGELTLLSRNGIEEGRGDGDELEVIRKG